MEGRELGTVVGDMLERGGWPERDETRLRSVPGAGEMSTRSVILLVWIQHVAGKSGGAYRERRVGDPQRASRLGERVTATVERHAVVPTRRSGLSVALLVLVMVLWFVSLARIDVGAIGALGLLSAFPLTMFTAFAVLTVSMARAVHREEPTPVLAAHVVVFLLVAHGTPAALYETLRYSWAWKHLGLVDYLACHHTVNPHMRNLNAYQSWPGFFTAATTWLVGSHASSWIGPAQWAPLAFELLDALALYAIFATLEADRRGRVDGGLALRARATGSARTISHPRRSRSSCTWW